MVSSANTAGGHELVIGLVGAIGVDWKRLVSKLKKELELVGYEARDVSLIQPILEWHPRWPCETQAYEELCHRKMDIGNDLRRWTKRKDVLAAVSMAEIRKLRAAHWEGLSQGDTNPADRPIERCAYILKSLKTPDEIELLRRVYGDNCFVLAAYSSVKCRKARLAEQIAESHSDSNTAKFEATAAQLMERDEQESGDDSGQNVQNTFCMADVFIDSDREEDIARQIERFIQILFGHPFRTPTTVEMGMFQAFGASRCSSSAGRQVGASVVNKWGDLLAVGFNEVAKAFGGHYQDGNPDDGRDHVRRSDSNAEMNRHVLEDLLARFQSRGWLSETYAEKDIAALVQCARSEKLLDSFSRDDAGVAQMPSLLKTARIRHGIEFIRAVHAEMAALMSMLRSGVSARECTMYVTTFPCHECAKHIVASGIEEVIFIEPYPKSRVVDLFSDSVVVDDPNAQGKVRFRPYLGIAPHRYLALFQAPQRKTNDGFWVDWEHIRRTQAPRLGGSFKTYGAIEEDFVARLNKELKVLYKEKKIQIDF